MSKQISIVTTDKFDVSFRDGSTAKFVDVPFDELQKNLASVIRGIDELFDASVQKLNNYELTEFAVSLEVSASGKVGILGTGVETSGTGGIELTFKRKET